MKGPFEGFATSTGSEEQAILEFLFPAKNRFQRLQMLGELQPRLIPPWSVTGLFRRLYDSKVLTIWQEECILNKVSQERKGRLEGAETAVASRRRLEDKED